jgi:hypothetical protein
MAKAKYYAFDLLFIAPKVGGQEQFFFLLAMRGTPSTKLESSKHGQGKTFCVQPPTYSTESRRLKTFFLGLLAMHGTPSTKLGSSKHGPCKLFGCQPPTFKAESRMSKEK